MNTIYMAVFATFLLSFQSFASNISESRLLEKLSSNPQWVLLKSIGWKISVNLEESKIADLHTANPLRLERFRSPLDAKDECKVACISIQKDSSKTLSELEKWLDQTILPKAIKCLPG